MKDDKKAQGPANSLEEVMAPVWCYQCKKQFSFKAKAGASQKRLPPREVGRLVSAALSASRWRMLDVVNEEGKETGQRTWFCESCADVATEEFEQRRRKAETRKPWRRVVW